MCSFVNGVICVRSASLNIIISITAEEWEDKMRLEERVPPRLAPLLQPRNSGEKQSSAKLAFHRGLVEGAADTRQHLAAEPEDRKSKAEVHRSPGRPSPPLG